ncbi:MAG: beta-propeller fold lactonase family protein, partial [Candidatus Limnocylindria bacterium]
DNILVGNRPRRFALTPDGETLWVSNEVAGTVSVIDLASNEVVGEIGFQPRGFRAEDITPVDLVINEVGTIAYVTLGGANHVAVVDVESRKPREYILVGSRPWGMALSEDQSTLYVTNGRSDDLSVIDTGDLSVSRSVPVGRVPYTVVIDE